MLYRHCYLYTLVLYLRVLAVADIEIRKFGKSSHFNLIQTVESSEEVKSVHRYHPYVVQNDIIFRRHLSQSGL